MRDTYPLLVNTDFPAIQRRRPETLQANLGYRCNQSCAHCHVAASPTRTEEMNWETMTLLLEFSRRHQIQTLDLTGGAPELNPHFRRLVSESTDMGMRVIDRCNLTILSAPGCETLAHFLADQQVEIAASLPCYLEENVDKQRGDGVFQASLDGLRRLNTLGYGLPESGLILNLVYNPLGASLPPDQATLEQAYKEQLATRYGIVFNQLFTIANMPIQRFGSQLLSRKEFGDYMNLLKNSSKPRNLESVMCRTLISVGWHGQVFDCDFNQMLGLPLGGEPARLIHLGELLDADFSGRPIRVADHCYGCTAGQGSSCGGSLVQEATPKATTAVQRRIPIEE